MPKLAYLVSCYPSVSHTFITKEVDSLRKNGYVVETFSINKAVGPFAKVC